MLYLLDATIASRGVFSCIVTYDSRASEPILVPRESGADTMRQVLVVAVGLFLCG